MIVIGVTGKIGSGKSTISNFFSQLGAKIIDADKISHRCLGDKREIIKKEFQRYGVNLTDEGKKLRKQLSQIVFDSKEMLKNLCQIIHPCIIENVKNKLAKIENLDSNSVVIIDSPLLFEMGVDELVDYIVFVIVPLEQRIERLTESQDLSKDEIIKRSRNQISLDDKKEEVDFTIDNAEEKDYAKKQVKKIWEELVHSS